MRLDAHSLLYAGAVQHRRPPARAMLETCLWLGRRVHPCAQSATARGVDGGGARCSRVPASRDDVPGPRALGGQGG